MPCDLRGVLRTGKPNAHACRRGGGGGGDGIEEFSNQIQVGTQPEFDTDLLKKNNVREDKQREVFGSAAVQTFEWSDIKQFFNENKMNFKGNYNANIKIKTPSKVCAAAPDAPTAALSAKYEKYLELVEPEEYEVWLQIGMALKRMGVEQTEWDAWPKSSSKYEQQTQDLIWNSFHKSEGQGFNEPTIR